MPNALKTPNSRHLPFFIAALVFIGLDVLTKQWALNTLVLGEFGREVIQPVLRWTLAYNYGAAFSFLANQPGWQRWFLVAVSVAAIIGVSVWLVKRRAHERLLPFGLALILAGAVGNCIDRIYYGYVIDFIHVYYETYHFPIFNVADICVSVGAGLVILSSFVDRKSQYDHRI